MTFGNCLRGWVCFFPDPRRCWGRRRGVSHLVGGRGEEVREAASWRPTSGSWIPASGRSRRQWSAVQLPASWIPTSSWEVGDAARTTALMVGGAGRCHGSRRREGRGRGRWRRRAAVERRA
uniref:Uncharacterized protein n=1 Tax=Oryza glaberrima TaxID=4538 RepID=I1QIY5_ORYGL